MKTWWDSLSNPARLRVIYTLLGVLFAGGLCGGIYLWNAYETKWAILPAIFGTLAGLFLKSIQDIERHLSE